MRKPSLPRKSQERLVPGLAWMMIRQPSGPIGVASKLNGPLIASHAEMLGLRRDWRSRFNVSSVWRRRRSHWPSVGRECWVDSRQDRYEVGFEGADCAFCFVASVHIRGHELVSAVPVVGDGRSVGRTCFVVKDLRVDSESFGTQSLHDGVVRWDPM